jgi:tRNA (guanine37-N1)-methyltransferase
MVLKPEPLFRVIRHVRQKRSSSKVFLFTPQGKRFSQQIAFDCRLLKEFVLICGRYEGVDERVAENLVDEEISIGDYVLSGGELAACVFLEAVTRLLPGVLNNSSSAVNESFAITPGGPVSDAGYCLLDCPQYTRPESFEGHAVPEVLLSGDHERVRLWRRRQALEKTLRNRPDLLEYEALTSQDKRLLE